jgi:hypothetical protein
MPVHRVLQYIHDTSIGVFKAITNDVYPFVALAAQILRADHGIEDAAFQAGWMKDHARRFRLRALMAEGLKAGAVSIGDLAMHLALRLRSRINASAPGCETMVTK